MTIRDHEAGERVLVTGGTGFLGSHVVQRLLRDGQHDVAILVRQESNLWRIEELLDSVTLIKGDLRQPSSLEHQLTEFEPHVVLHLAWSGVLGSARNSPDQVENIQHSLELIRMTARAGGRYWIGLGSQAEYGPCSQVIDEREPTHPTTLYGVSKLATNLVANQLCEQLGLRFAWVRLFSCFGPKDHPSWFIPYVILKFFNGVRPAVTLAEQQWDYLYVADAADALCRLVAHPEAQGVFNLGSGQAFKLRELLENIRDRIDPSRPIGFGELPYRSDQVMYLKADIRRLHEATGWQPATSLTDAIAETVRWYGEHRDNYPDN